MQFPTNYAVDFTIFREITGINMFAVQRIIG